MKKLLYTACAVILGYCACIDQANAVTKNALIKKLRATIETLESAQRCNNCGSGDGSNMTLLEHIRRNHTSNTFYPGPGHTILCTKNREVALPDTIPVNDIKSFVQCICNDLTGGSRRVVKSDTLQESTQDHNIKRLVVTFNDVCQCSEEPLLVQTDTNSCKQSKYFVAIFNTKSQNPCLCTIYFTDKDPMNDTQGYTTIKD